MLEEIRISNFAIIDQLDLGFGKGLNVITGETGAGKSIMLDALGTSLVRSALSRVVLPQLWRTAARPCETGAASRFARPAAGLAEPRRCNQGIRSLRHLFEKYALDNDRRARIMFPAANSDDSIPFAASPLFGNLTEWDCTNEDHRPVICFRIGRMHCQPAERQRRVPRKPIVSA
jgi:hypothetical protein